MAVDMTATTSVPYLYRNQANYFRGEFHCARKGGAKCFAVDGENVVGGDDLHPQRAQALLYVVAAWARAVSAQVPLQALNLILVLPVIALVGIRMPL